jgi:hypothetical protein
MNVSPKKQSPKRLGKTDLGKIAACFPKGLNDSQTEELRTYLNRAYSRSLQSKAPKKSKVLAKLHQLEKLLRRFLEAMHEPDFNARKEIPRWLSDRLVDVVAHESGHPPPLLQQVDFVIGGVGPSYSRLAKATDELKYLHRVLCLTLEIAKDQKDVETSKRAQNVWFISAIAKIWTKLSGQKPTAVRQGRESRELKEDEFVKFAKAVSRSFGLVIADYLIEEVVERGLGALGPDLKQVILRHASRMHPLGDEKTDPTQDD